MPTFVGMTCFGGMTCFEDASFRPFNRLRTGRASPEPLSTRTSTQQLRIQVTPLRILFLDQLDLPLSLPLLQLPFAHHHRERALVQLEPDQLVDAVLLGESADQA